MKAYIRKMRYDEKSGKHVPMLGSDNTIITKEYKLYRNLRKYATKGLEGLHRIEAYHDFDNDCFNKYPDTCELFTV